MLLIEALMGYGPRTLGGSRQDRRHALGPSTNHIRAAILLLDGGENLFLIFQDLVER
jgi:hypothetical protein